MRWLLVLAAVALAGARLARSAVVDALARERMVGYVEGYKLAQRDRTSGDVVRLRRAERRR